MYKNLTSLTQVPKLERGCDSAYSWAPEAAHLTTKWEDSEVLTSAILKERDTKNKPDILSLTGGEPTLHQKALSNLIVDLAGEFKFLLIETNASLPLKPEFCKALKIWTQFGGAVVFSNSPKFSFSGEKREDAWKPNVIADQSAFMESLDNLKNCGIYFKFVVDGSTEALAEVKEYMSLCEVSPQDVWLMPVGDTEPQIKKIARTVAQQCLDNGFNYSGRLHVNIWNDEVGR